MDVGTNCWYVILPGRKKKYLEYLIELIILFEVGSINTQIYQLNESLDIYQKNIAQ